MSANRLGAVIKHLRNAAAKDGGGTAGDRELLRRFVCDGEEAAFEVLLTRHGPMVLSVCRRVLADQHLVEDAFQATFLVLVRKAGSIRKADLLANWLYGVAYRAASKAKVAAAKRRAREGDVIPKQTPDLLSDITARELLAVLDGELSTLPPRFRAPLVLCYLEGMTRDEAAQQIGWSLATLARRLERGRELLRTRLARKGVGLSAALFPVMLSQSTAAACAPNALVGSTLKSAMLILAGEGAAGVISTQVAALTEGVLKAMLVNKLKLVCFIAVSALFLASAGWFLQVYAADKPPEANVQVAGQGDAKPNAQQAKTPSDVPAIWPEKSVVKGRVVDHQGMPVPNAEVLLLGEERVIVDAPTGNWFVPSTEKGKLPNPPTAKTNQNGEFTIERKEGSANRLGVIAKDPFFWVVPRRSLPRGDDVVIKLPPSGSLAVQCDLPGKPAKQGAHLEVLTFDDVDWNIDTLRFHGSQVSMPNPGEVVFERLPPARFAVDRLMYTPTGERQSLVSFTDRRVVKIESNQRAVVRIDRKLGRPVTGRVKGLEKVELGYALVTVNYWGPEEAPSEYGGRSRRLTSFDVIPITSEGSFTTDPIPPGKYIFSLSAGRSAPPGERAVQEFNSKWVEVTIPEQGEMPKVEIIAQNQGEQLFREMEEKLSKAKALDVSIEINIEEGAEKKKLEGSLASMRDNKVRMELSGELDGKQTTLLVVSDGSRWKTTGLGPEGPARDTPNGLDAAIRAQLARAGVFFPLFAVHVEAGQKEFKPDDYVVSDFRIGKPEKLGEWDVRPVGYDLTLQPAKETFSVTLWVESKTVLPRKRVFSSKLQDRRITFTETYTRITLDGKLDEKMFVLP